MKYHIEIEETLNFDEILSESDKKYLLNSKLTMKDFEYMAWELKFYLSDLLDELDYDEIKQVITTISYIECMENENDFSCDYEKLYIMFNIVNSIYTWNVNVGELRNMNYHPRSIAVYKKIFY